MTKSNLLQAIPPIVALISLLSLWASNRTAARELMRLTTTARAMEEAPAFDPGRIETSHELPRSPEIPKGSAEIPEETSPAELPPLVVPGTMDDLGHTVAAAILRQLELEKLHGDGYEDAEPGSAEFEVIAKELQSMMHSITPIMAGRQVLSEELNDPIKSGRCVAVIVGDLIGLGDADTDVIAHRLGELRLQSSQGEDPDLLNRAFFEASRDLISDSQAEFLKQYLGGDFPSMPVNRMPF
ncbi:MAG: hypothetical protein ACR2RV_10370 [Verrucomicrobiales bacterium]